MIPRQAERHKQKPNWYCFDNAQRLLFGGEYFLTLTVRLCTILTSFRYIWVHVFQSETVI